jgi:hypothetical protein
LYSLFFFTRTDVDEDDSSSSLILLRYFGFEIVRFDFFFDLVFADDERDEGIDRF